MDVGLKVNLINNGQVYLNSVKSLQLVMERYVATNTQDRTNGLYFRKLWWNSRSGADPEMAHQGTILIYLFIQFAPSGKRNGLVYADGRKYGLELISGFDKLGNERQVYNKLPSVPSMFLAPDQKHNGQVYSAMERYCNAKNIQDRTNRHMIVTSFPVNHFCKANR